MIVRCISGGERPVVDLVEVHLALSRPYNFFPQDLVIDLENSPVPKTATLDDLIDVSKGTRVQAPDGKLLPEADAIPLEDGAPPEKRNALLKEKLSRPPFAAKALYYMPGGLTFAFIPYRKIIDIDDPQDATKKMSIIQHTFEPVTLSETRAVRKNPKEIFPPKKEAGKPGIIETSKMLTDV